MRILSVTPRHDTQGKLWIVRTDDHQTLATRSMLFATFADRARELCRPVTMQTAAGHYYRDILLIDFADYPTAPSTEAESTLRRDAETVTPGHGETDPGTSPKGEL